MKRFFASAFLIFSLSACASALDSATQEVTVLTPGAHDSVCFLDNGEMKYRAWPPQTLRMSKRPGELTVRCLADGNRERTIVIDADHQDIVLANAVNGFLPGMFIDFHTGAMFAYPQIITVDFTEMKAQTMRRPNYDLYLMENPGLFGMEEFRPGDAALIRDKYYEPTELKKRDIPGSGNEDNFIEGTRTEPEPVPQPPEGAYQKPSSDMVSDLTRKMNPQVFGPAEEGAAEGAMKLQGSDPGVASTGPVTIYPVE